jgi:hypothetical protein
MRKEIELIEAILFKRLREAAKLEGNEKALSMFNYAIRVLAEISATNRIKEFSLQTLRKMYMLTKEADGYILSGKTSLKSSNDKKIVQSYRIISKCWARIRKEIQLEIKKEEEKEKIMAA